MDTIEIKLAAGVAFIFSMIFTLIALWGKKESRQINMLCAIHSLLICIACGGL